MDLQEFYFIKTQILFFFRVKRQFGKGTLVSIHVEPVKKSNEATE